MPSGDLFSIGTSGLLAFQRALGTVSHNIANANTEGYSRQSADLVSKPPQANGDGFIGTGVEVGTIRRSYDAFVESSLRSSTSATAEFEAFHALASQLDNVVANSDTGINASLQRFFDSVQDVADTPASPSTRQVMLSEGEQLTTQFNELASWIEGIRGQVNNELQNGVNQINQYSSAVAELNEKIVVELGRAGQPPNDLLDQRDTLIKQMSEWVSVTTLQQDDGAINVLVGSGQALVVANKATSLTTMQQAGDPKQLDIAVQGNAGVLVPVTSQMSGGRIGGVLNFRDQMLDQASNNLGLVAIGLGSFANEQHRRGMDLDGALGLDFFNIAQPQVLTVAGNPANVAVAFDDVTQLSNADYKLRFNAGTWELSNSLTGQTIPMTGAGTTADPFVAEGMSIEVSGAPANGDTYLLRPTRNGALEMQMLLANSRQIAAAAPVRSVANTNNTGTGDISAGVVTDIDNPVFQTTPDQLTPPVLMRFTSSTSYDLYDNTNTVTPVLLEAGIAYDPATGGELFPTPGGLDHGYRMRITGAPVAGDEFSTEYNTGGIGDNRNALLLAGLATEKLLYAGSASVTDSYKKLVADVGTGTKQAEINSLAQQRILDQTRATRESISGVNLDEEAANLVRYQQAYQAAAQVIATAGSLFDTLLSAVRR
ncbi:MAG: flagellar hook-associated protein FlgK [Gammaproteobacteria bacterium]|nr:flagellar hook-associated protein FlgK [Gammaproteobacteria bacterium]